MLVWLGRFVAFGLGILAGTLLLALVDSVRAEDGFSTWYGPGFDGQTTASGEIFRQDDPTTAASTSYPLGTRLHVSTRGGDRAIDVRVTDTGLFTRPHLLDLSKAGFAELADPDAGVVDVRVEVIGDAND